MKNEQPVPMADRRDEVRYSVTLDVLWQGANGRSEGTISDLNWSGCSILSGARVQKGETVHVFLTIRGGVRVQLTGVVTNVSEEIGFGVRFNELNGEQWAALDGVIMRHRNA